MAPTATPAASLAAAPPPAPTPDVQADTIQGMAGRIRAKFPGAYDDKSDVDLVDRWTQKNPAYLNRLTPSDQGRLPSRMQTALAHSQSAVDAVKNEMPSTAGTIAREVPLGALSSFGFKESKSPAAVVASPFVGMWQQVKPLTPLATPDEQRAAVIEGSGVPQRLRATGDVADAVQNLKAGRYGAAAKSGADAFLQESVGQIPAVGPGAADALQRLMFGNDTADRAHAAGELAGTAAQFLIPEAVDKFADVTARPRQAAAETMTRPTIARPLRTLRAEERYGHSPERAIVSEKVTTSGQAADKMEQVGQALDDKLLSAPGTNIDIDKIVDQAWQRARANAQRAGERGAIGRIDDVHDAMINEYGNLQKAPRAAAEMYRDVRKRVTYGPDAERNLVADFRKDVADGISDAVKTQVPDVAPLFQRYGDLASAYGDMKRVEDTNSMKFLPSRVTQGATYQGIRKLAQLLGTQYDELPARPTPPTLNQAPGGAGPLAPSPAAPAGQGGAPAAAAPPQLPGRLALPGNPPIVTPTPPGSVTPPAPGPTLNAGPGMLRGLRPGYDEEFLRNANSFVGPEDKPTQIREAGSYPTNLPSSGSVLEAGAAQKAARPPAKPLAPSKPDLTPEQQKLQDRGDLAQLERDMKQYREQSFKAKSHERIVELREKEREASARAKELRERLGFTGAQTAAEPSTAKPSAQPLSGPKNPTYEALHPTVKKFVDNMLEDLRHQPQGIRDPEEQRLRKFGGTGVSLKEAAAMKYGPEMEQARKEGKLDE